MTSDGTRVSSGLCYEHSLYATISDFCACNSGFGTWNSGFGYKVCSLLLTYVLCLGNYRSVDVLARPSKSLRACGKRDWTLLLPSFAGRVELALFRGRSPAGRASALRNTLDRIVHTGMCASQPQSGALFEPFPLCSRDTSCSMSKALPRTLCSARLRDKGVHQR